LETPTIFWGVIGKLVGFYRTATYLPTCQFGHRIPLSSVELRLIAIPMPVILFAQFVGKVFFTGVYYSLQRFIKTRCKSDTLSKINFGLRQLIIVSAVLTLPMGITT